MSELFKRNLWKIGLTLVIMVWAITELVPLKNLEFDEFLRSRALAEIITQATQPGINAALTAGQKVTFASLLTEAQARVKADPKTTPSLLVALRQIGHDRQLDLSGFFPDINLGTLKNVDKRNSLVLGELQRQAKGRVQLGLDLNGGVAITLEVHGKDGGNVPDEMLKKAIEIIDQRINSLGVTEPLIRQVGGNRIEVQLPGQNLNDNPDLIRDLVKPARLEFRLVRENSGPQLRRPMPEEVPTGYVLMEQVDENGANATSYYIVKQRPEMTGDRVAQASVVAGQLVGYEISLRLTDVGAKEFGALTSANVGRNLAIVLDGKLHSAPVIRSPITNGVASISGNFDQREAFDLKSVLNNPLDAELTVLDQTAVGPSLAADAIASGRISTGIAVVAVSVFMLVVYTFGGVVALLSLVVNVLLIFGVMANLGATLTLPGLAGIVLTIGMAVDANILIFERMREELAVGKSLATSNQSGFLKALTTILDAHLVQLIICAVMIEFGAGPIKGFGVTLAIGVCSTLFSVLITGHLLMELAVESGAVRSFIMLPLLKDLRLDFVRYGKPAFIASGLLVVVGFGYVLTQGNAIFGRDFKGGDEISMTFARPPSEAEVRALAKRIGVADVGITAASPLGGDKKTFKIEMAEGKAPPVLAALKTGFPNAGLDEKSISVSQLGQTIGSEILWNALKAVTISMAVILLYIAFRFEFGFGVGAMVSTLHDILMTIGVFVLTGHQFNAPMVAAILCIAGYSINETVVVFDRIREELRLNPTGRLKDVINEAIRKVFARTIKTATTTFLAALALYLFGGGVLKDIAFTFMVGIVTSTFSAIFVAAQVFYWWHRGDRKHVEAHADAAPVYEWTASSKASE
ncbi:MAG: protein translocase subunit SecD [Verrucomicrobiota bacterium]